MEIIIRNIEERDIPEVVDIQINGWKSAYKGIIDELYLNSMNREEKIKNRKEDYKKGLFIVAEINKKIVGFCRYYDNVISRDGKEFDCELMAIYVAPDLKQQGIGKNMFTYVKNDLKSKSKTKMILWCLKENYPSRIFYEKMGGKIIGEHNIEIGGKLYQEIGFGYNL